MANYRRRRWREAMAVRLDLNGLLATAVGVDGLAAEEVAELEPRLSRVREDLAARRAAGTLAFADLPHRRVAVHPRLEAASLAGTPVIVPGLVRSASHALDNPPHTRTIRSGAIL